MGKKVSKQQMQATDVVNRQHRKKVYNSPELVVWGSIEDLTRGSGGTLPDADLTNTLSSGDFF